MADKNPPDKLTDWKDGDPLPKDLTGIFPTSALAVAWAKENGGKIPCYTLVAGAATLQGYWVCDRPIRNPYDGIFHRSTVPPQWRSVDSKVAFDVNSHGVVADQPNWDWTPDYIPTQKQI